MPSSSSFCAYSWPWSLGHHLDDCKDATRRPARDIRYSVGCTGSASVVWASKTRLKNFSMSRSSSCRDHARYRCSRVGESCPGRSIDMNAKLLQQAAPKSSAILQDKSRRSWYSTSSDQISAWRYILALALQTLDTCSNNPQNNEKYQYRSLDLSQAIQARHLLHLLAPDPDDISNPLHSFYSPLCDYGLGIQLSSKLMPLHHSTPMPDSYAFDR